MIMAVHAVRSGAQQCIFCCKTPFWLEKSPHKQQGPAAQVPIGPKLAPRDHMCAIMSVNRPIEKPKMVLSTSSENRTEPLRRAFLGSR